MFGTLIGLLILIADIWAILQVFKSSASTAAKIGWTLLILIFPVVGFIIWFLVGPGGKKL